VAVQAVSVLVQLLRRGSLPVQEGALDALLAASTGMKAERRVQIAAAEAVAAVSRDIEAPVAAAPALSPIEAMWTDAADGHLPDDPRVLRAVIGERADRAPLQILHRLVEAVRAREAAITMEGGAKAVTKRDEWRRVRGALHQALALRGSRIALYDLRETVSECGEPLPHSFMAAIQVIGDASCLEPLAKAFARAGKQDEIWRHQLATAFHHVVRRERINQRSAALRRALARSPQLAS
jgi:hypothetical protein